MLTNEPNLPKHIIDRYYNVDNSRFNNVKFKGFLEFDYNEDVKFSYYGVTSIDERKIYLVVETFEYEDLIGDENSDFDTFIANKTREYNRNSVNNISYSKEEVKELLLPNLNIDNVKEYCKEFKYCIFFSGCDDGSSFIRFNSEEKRDAFLEKLLRFEKFENLFEYEEENFVLFYFN